MTGCAKRCKQGLVKFAISVHKLVTGTLIKVNCVSSVPSPPARRVRLTVLMTRPQRQGPQSRYRDLHLSAHPYKADDDLEMTMVCHRPEGLDQLQAQTNFSKRELQVLYRGFKNECPSGIVNEDTFKQIYSQFFPHGDASQYAHYLFNAFDTGHSGSIKFEDFVSALSILLRGTITEKLQWTFNLYDINRDGYINKEEMTDIVRAIYDMMGKYTYPVLKTDTPKQHVEAFFQKMDKNRDGVVTLDEFILSCQEDENIMRSLQLFENVI